MSALASLASPFRRSTAGSGCKLAIVRCREELSRGYIGVGSLGTRSEIAADLILSGGTRSSSSAAGCPRSLRAKVLRLRRSLS